MSDYTSNGSTVALKIELERIEALLRRALAAAAAGALTSFAGPIVANQAAATALPASTYVTSRQVYTLAQEAIWQFIPGVAGAVGVPPLAADEVIAATGGVLARTPYSSPKWRVGVNDIFIDPANVAASNENDGFTAGTPLKTGYELHRRWGWGGSKPVVGPNLVTSPDGFTNIHTMSDIASPDSLPLKVTLAANASMRVVAPLLAANILRTSTLTDAVTAMNPAVPAPGGTRLRIRDNTLANWAAFMVANRRVRFLNGPAAGGTFQPQTDVVAAPGGVDGSAAQTTAEPAFSVSPATVTPAVGNTYVVEKLVVVNLGTIDIDQEFNSFGFDAFINFIDINLPTTGSELWVPRSATGFGGPFFNFYKCTIDRIIDVSLSNTLLIACYGSQGVFGTGAGKFNPTISGGGWNGGIPGASVQIAFGTATLDEGIDFNCVINKPLVVAVTQAVKSFAVWNALATAGVNAAGHGVMIGGGGPAPFFGVRGASQCKGTIWGQGNGGAGMLIGAACSGIGAPQNITGVQGDLKLANKLVGWWWNDATAVYNPVGAGIALSWANLLAAEGAAGFGGNAHELDSNSHFVAVETTA